MGTLFTFLIIIIAITILRFAKDSYKDYKKVAKEGGIRNKYNVLINHFIDLDPQMKIIKETNMYCYLSEHPSTRCTCRGHSCRVSRRAGESQQHR